MNVSAKLNEKNSKVVIMNNDVLNIQFYMSLVATAVKVARTGKVMVDFYKSWNGKTKQFTAVCEVPQGYTPAEVVSFLKYRLEVK
jgi:hypothetical protein